ncbi:MAG TPA: bifunctional PIG-L family deacetylase/class I SAM-dependent methyltransferase [Pseudonocardiaceae bacterium]|nr:bifunctional PIG-L family deacetylase/class I SAM-dependent methyltransferase [Pseudonocardiaceae bacterium]
MSGTAESRWRAWLSSAELRDFPIEPGQRVAVVAAHPDDETLAVSGLLQQLHAQGSPIDLIVATDGEAAFPRLSTADRRELGRTRRAELRESLRAQGLSDMTVRWLGLPDSGLADRRDELAERLGPLLAGADLCLLPWPGDPHPDHAAAGDAVVAAAPLTAHRWSYPIWMWHWMAPDDPAIPRGMAFGHRLGGVRRDRKAAGLAAFASQLKPGPNDEPPILEPDMLDHFDRDVEVVFREPPRQSAPLSRFAELYAADSDPWQVGDRWYERRKRALTMASLPSERYATAVEPACGTGVLTAALADRCDRVVAFDPVPAAVAAARARTAELANVVVTEGRLPGDLPPGPADLVVFSEILYYLDDDTFTVSVDAAVAALRPGGQLVAVDWLPWAAEAPRDGPAVHRFLTGIPTLESLVTHVDERFVLHVLARR